MAGQHKRLGQRPTGVTQTLWWDPMQTFVATWINKRSDFILVEYGVLEKVQKSQKHTLTKLNKTGRTEQTEITE